MSTCSSNTFTKTFATKIATKHHGVADTKISQTTPLNYQVANNTGGYCYITTDEVYTRRLVVMGTINSTYYSSANKLTDDAVTFMSRMVDEKKGMMILNTLRDVHESGSAPKMTMTLTILGFLTRCTDDAVRKAALDYTIVGLRTLSQLYTWLDSHISSGHGKGFGRGPKTVMTYRFHNNSSIKNVPHHVMMTDPRRYYPGMTAKEFAYQVTKYGQRDGMSASDVISLIHPKPTKAKRPKTVRKIVDGKPVYEPVAGTGGETAGYVPWPLAKRVILAYVKNDIAVALHCALKTLDASAEVVPKTTLMEFYPIAFASVVDGLNDSTKEVLTYLWACDRVKSQAVDIDLAIQLIKEHNIPREVLATSLLTDRRVWLALLFVDSYADKLKVRMPIIALIRNLGVMSARGLFDTSVGDKTYKFFTGKVVAAVAHQLVNKDVIVRGRVHPASIISALKTYETGKGVRGSTTWTVCREIVTALNNAVDIAFHTVQATGCDELHFLDISGSMTDASSSVEHLSASDAASIQLLTTIRSALRAAAEGKPSGRQIMGIFDTKSTLVYDSDPNASSLKINKTINDDMEKIYKKLGVNSRLNNNAFNYALHYKNQSSTIPTTDHNLFDPMTATYGEMWDSIHGRFPMGGTDCSQPIIEAMVLAQKGIAYVKNIYVYTDNETYAGRIHPSVAMKEYRKLVPGAKLIIIAATPTNFTIADPTDSGMLDVVGFDVGAASVIYDFAKDTSIAAVV